MANSDKNIIITPYIGNVADPQIVFSGANTTVGPQNITLSVLPASNGTLSFSGSVGQLFSITNNLTGTIFSVNDVSGIPSIEVLSTGEVKLAQYSGNVLIGGTTTDGVSKLQVTGAANVSSLRIAGFGQVINSAGTWTGNPISAAFPVSNGTSNINAAVNANITVGVSGTANVAVFATTGQFVTGIVSASGNVISNNEITNIYLNSNTLPSGGTLNNPGFNALKAGPITVASGTAYTISNLNVMVIV